MNRAFFAACMVAAFAVSPAHADPRADVLAAVDTALKAINTQDAALFEKIMLPGAIITAQRYDANGVLRSGVLTVPEMAKRLRQPGHTIEESIHEPTVLVQRDLAHVWAPYTLDYDGKRLHCGVDSFGLAKIDGSWRLTSLTWTAEPKGCAG
ncbi:MAG: hypothetical protein ACOYKQ_02815 [Polymorphobacter sp.]